MHQTLYLLRNIIFTRASELKMGQVHFVEKKGVVDTFHYKLTFNLYIF